jgi:hypothetical protein
MQTQQLLLDNKKATANMNNPLANTNNSNRFLSADHQNINGNNLFVHVILLKTFKIIFFSTIILNCNFFIFNSLKIANRQINF